ncbi:MAG: 50S ribosomal protein L25 [Syntrophomonas sp.]|uniref:50S ribosomal protein L25 n=1 Tax=Syntrophomonas sp. TaxID=2053627 RepID=UPI00260AD85D|nr:50S ribosomal protein L25 [Syntrophomonas sp.]MDD2511018.1 50S ribosomal protein L25 [Syntrophomonas sp.]MDD3879828.1 50S ribosomal protein L25 [Syntrophomonas sp.]MDD4626341.1 50S ribosomal protein L25 [Syntrophomonas sp.]
MLGEKLNCRKREIKNRGYLNQLKRSEQVPAVIYGKGDEAIPISLEKRQLNKAFTMHGSRGLFSLELEGESQLLMTLVREVQRNPVSGQLIHVDFLSINMNEKITSSVGVLLSGEEEIIKKGGILQTGLKEVEVQCFPQDLPEYLGADISSLEIGETLHVSDLTSIEGVEILADADAVVASILAPSKATADEEEMEAEGAADEADGAEDKPEQ